MNIRLKCFGFPLLVAVASIMAGCGGSGDVSPGGGSAPTVTSTSPVRDASQAPISRRITATFSEAMNPASLTSTSFSAFTPSGALAGTVSYEGSTATLLLDQPMPANTRIAAKLTTGVTDLSGVGLKVNYVWSFTTRNSSDTTAPTVSSTDPASDATGVAINKSVSAVFSEPMLSSSLNTTTFKVRGPAGLVDGSVSLIDNVAVFNPTANLTSNTTFTATITVGAQDLSENSLAENKVWTFTTGSTSDTTAPKIVSTDPSDDATNVSTNKKISVTFDDVMDVATLKAKTIFLSQANGTVVPASISYASKVAVLDPTNALAPNAVYTMKVTRGVTDSSGNALELSKTWTFTTAGSGDSIPPTVLSTNPINNATNVFLNKSISATFSEAMQATTVNTLTFSVTSASGAPVSGAVSYDTGSRIGTFKPSVDLLQNTTYTAHLGTGAKDSAGNPLADPKVWNFTTGVQRAQTQINLGAATNYAVLAGSTVTNGGPSVINGDLGVSPGSAVTGFPPGKVNGAIHAGDSAAAQAKADLLAGQLDAAGRLGGATLPGDLAGLTFTPGLYKNNSSVMLSTGSVTLDAQGDPDAVFIFQMATTLTTSTGTQIILAGGAKASNIYWSVGSSATLGVNSIFKGIILAEVSITVNNGASNDGTFLTKIGAVTLQANKINRALRVRN